MFIHNVREREVFWGNWGMSDGNDLIEEQIKMKMSDGMFHKQTTLPFTSLFPSLFSFTHTHVHFLHREFSMENVSHCKLYDRRPPFSSHVNVPWVWNDLNPDDVCCLVDGCGVIVSQGDYSQHLKDFHSDYHGFPSAIPDPIAFRSEVCFFHIFFHYSFPQFSSFHCSFHFLNITEGNYFSDCF